MIDPYKTKVFTNVKKVKGQIEHIEKMLSDNRYCMDVAQQCNAAIGLLKQMNNLILESHLHTCGAHFLNSKDEMEKEKFIKELVRVCNVTNR